MVERCFGNVEYKNVLCTQYAADSRKCLHPDAPRTLWFDPPCILNYPHDDRASECRLRVHPPRPAAPPPTP